MARNQSMGNINVLCQGEIFPKYRDGPLTVVSDIYEMNSIHFDRGMTPGRTKLIKMGLRI